MSFQFISPIHLVAHKISTMSHGRISFIQTIKVLTSYLHLPHTSATTHQNGEIERFFLFSVLIRISFTLFLLFSSKNWRICAAVLILCGLSAAANGYKVLVLGPMNGPSHFLYVSSFVRALLGRGHEVTYLTSNSLKNHNLANYTEVLIDTPFNFASSCEF